MATNHTVWTDDDYKCRVGICTQRYVKVSYLHNVCYADYTSSQGTSRLNPLRTGSSAGDQWPYLITSIIKCGTSLVIHFQAPTVAPMKFGNGEVVSFHTLQSLDNLPMQGLMLNNVNKRGPH